MAFHETSLASVTIPASVTSIGDAAFRYCSSLTSVTFQGSIPSSGFSNNPASPVFIGDLRTKYLAGGPGTYTTTAPVSIRSVWTKQGGGGNSGDLVFTSIPDFKAWLDAQPDNTVATAYNVKLNVSDFGGSYTTTGSAGSVLYTNKNKYVFLDLSGSKKLLTIPDNAFSMCPTDIACTTLVGITIPVVGAIMQYSFVNCINLASVTIPDGVRIIYNSFTNSGLTSVTIPNSITAISPKAFGDCARLAAINVGSGNNDYCSENGVLYNKSKTTLHTYPAGKTAGSFIIPDGVTKIENFALSGSANLTSVTIPDSVTSIGYDVFGGCTSLTSVTFKGTISSFGSNPGDLREKYLAGGPGTYTTTAPVSYKSVWTKQ